MSVSVRVRLLAAIAALLCGTAAVVVVVLLAHSVI